METTIRKRKSRRERKSAGSSVEIANPVERADYEQTSPPPSPEFRQNMDEPFKAVVSSEPSSILSTYCREISEEALLTIDEEIKLSRQVQRGNKKARERMIKANLRLVIRIAKQFQGMGLPLLDLINEGNIGLMRAVEKFDPTKGAKFSTYSSFWIKHAIRLSLSNQTRTIRIPVHMVDRVAKLRKVETQYHEEFGRAPTDEEIGEELELSEHQMRVLRSASLSQISLEQPIEAGEDRHLGDKIADESAPSPWDQLEQDNTSTLVSSLMDQLREREVRILQHRFGLDGEEPMTLEEIGQKFGVTRERIRQLEAGALQKMRKQLKKLEKSNWKN